jgi:xylulokinase
MKMASKVVLGIEVGTTNVKAMLFELNGTERSSSVIEYNTIYLDQGWVEQNPEDWWKSVKTAIKTVLSNSDVDPSMIIGIGVSAQGCGVLPIEKNGNPLSNAIIWMDRRATDEAIWMQENAAEKILQINGNAIDPYHPIPTILWIKNHQPEIFDKAHSFLPVESYINYKLTGTISMNTSEAGLFHTFDTRKKTWSAEICDLLRFPVDKLPGLYEGDEVIGSISGSAAEETGLRKETLVVAGALDTPGGVLGAGCVRNGQSFLTIGTGSNIGAVINRPIIEPKLILFPHAVKGLWILDGSMASTGSVYKWFRDEFCAVEKEFARLTNLDPYQTMNEMASIASPGCGGAVLLPYFAGELCPIWDKHAKGILVGLSHQTTKNDFARLILEGCAYKLRHNIEVAQEAGVAIHELRSVGGGSKSQLWNQINADVTGKTVLVPNVSDAGALGGAILAGLGTGCFQNAVEAADQMVKIKAVCEPNQKNHEIYSSLYEIYRSIYEKLKPELRVLSTNRLFARNS